MKKISKYAIFYYDKQDEILINYLEEYLNANAEKIFNFFDNNLLRRKVKIHIIPTKKEYDNIVRLRRNTNEIPKWEIGCATSTDEIKYVSLYDYKNTSHSYDENNFDKTLNDYKKNIIHEFVHFVTYLFCKKYSLNYPLKYLSEGIAQYLSKQKDDINLNFDYTLDNILNSNSNYNGWFLITKYIIENYSHDYFIKLLSNKDYALKETSKLYLEAKEYYSNLQINNNIKNFKEKN